MATNELVTNGTSSTSETPTTRYAQPRKLLNWRKTDHLCVVKMLAWLIYDREEIRNAAALQARVDLLCERVVHLALGEEGVTFAAIKDHTLEEQGIAITPQRLLQRADKTGRYGEFNRLFDVVAVAYGLIRADE